MEKEYYEKTVYGRSRKYLSTNNDQKLWARITRRATISNTDMDTLSELFEVTWVQVDLVTKKRL